MENQYESLESSEVIEILFRPLVAELGLSSYFKFLLLSVIQFETIIERNLSVSDEIKEQIFKEDVDCNILRYSSKKWHSGKIKVKVTVEFCPDEPEEEIEENSGDNNSEELEFVKNRTFTHHKISKYLQTKKITYCQNLVKIISSKPFW
ncbi:MAG: KGK domain-containing protein [Cyanobacteriota bacterium]|nr:KGK domain-containing protein [Cyanobacteriota bacterium]